MTEEHKPDELPPPGELRFRHAEQIGVSFPDRTIELIVMPYETEALVPHPRQPNRLITEICTRGAFNGVERRPNRIRVNRDHKPDRTIGRAVALYPSRDEGLVAKVRIAPTPLGDETLALADEECLDASAGFLPMRDGEVWETRNRCRLTKCWLGHIALVPEPAYESARVLAVRSQGEPATPAVTPNLNSLRIHELERMYAEIDARYSVR